ncbi:MAG: aminomethyl-transferring glycine dehydrogenase subunit GcvPA [Chloroflexi bacterium]|nr:aminomethyl-transferring glycine dehydrogenase subunit GcvPA [Chloroflexota bacterium]
MLSAIGASKVADLLAVIPGTERSEPLRLPQPLTELELQRHLRSLAEQNRHTLQLSSFLGGGAYSHFIPAAIPALSLRGEFATSYTPYQPEVSQGTLQAMYEFQSMVCALTGLEAANASVYDGATALAEATVMARNITGRDIIVVPRSLHAHYLSVLHSYRVPLRIVGDSIFPHFLFDLASGPSALDASVAAVVVPSPNTFGRLEDWCRFAELAHAVGALLIAVFHPIALGLLESPGACGADIAVAEGQPLGIPVSFGGPSLGIMATRQRYLRHLPGRIAGVAVDRDGKEGFVLTLRAREQDIRRDRASSNICTNQSLLALQAAMYLSLLGPQGLHEVAEICLRRAHYLAQRITSLPGFTLMESPFFNEFVVRCPIAAGELAQRLLPYGILAGIPLGRWFPELADCLLICVTELNTRQDLDDYVSCLERLGL